MIISRFITITLLFCLQLPLLTAQLEEIGYPLIPAPEFTIYVSTSGSDSNDGSSLSPVATFQTAITLIPFNDQEDVHGEIVYLEGDYYPETPLRQSVNQYQSGNSFKHISIRGAGEVNIYGDNTLAGSHLVALRGSGIKVENINLFNAKSIGLLIANFAANGQLTNSSQIHDVLIRDVYVNQTESHGIITFLVDTITFDNVTVTRACQENTGDTGNCQWGSALRTVYCREVRVQDCTIFHNRGEGINIASTTGALVESCVSYDNFAANIYCIRTNNAIFRKNLLYNRDSIYWRSCEANQGGTPQERKPSAGFSIANEVGYEDFFSNACVPERTYANGVFTNKMADSIFFYNNILILAPIHITDESTGNCFFPQFSRSNNFSNIFIENNTLIGNVSPDHDYLIKYPLVNMAFDLTYFWGCFPNANGVGKFTADNIVFQNNIVSLAGEHAGEPIKPTRIFYGGRPCNGGALGNHFTTPGNLWYLELSPIYDSYAFATVPNFMFGPDNTVDQEMLTYCEPETELDNLTPDSLNNQNRFFKKATHSTYITEDFYGNPRGALPADLSNVGAVESSSIVGVVEPKPELDDVKLFPNPTRDLVYVDLNGKQINAIFVYNTVGQIQECTISRIAENRIEIDLEKRQNGLYAIFIHTNTGTEVHKVIKY